MKGENTPFLLSRVTCHGKRNSSPPAEAKYDGAPKGQRVHRPGQGERSETTPWVGKPHAWRPIRGKSNTL